MSDNIVYRTDSIYNFYKENRIRWDHFYDSEKYVFEHIRQTHQGFGDVLDIGCATGGLGCALAEGGSIRSYTGIDINSQAIDAARASQNVSFPTAFILGDVLTDAELASRTFTNVFSLGAADWNVETRKIIEKAWQHVEDAGHLVISLRLTLGEGVNSIEDSYQYILFNDEVASGDTEKAPYVVFNITQAIDLLASLPPTPTSIFAYGYWGAPSSSASTPYDKLLFTVFAVRKPHKGATSSGPKLDLKLPAEVLEQIGHDVHDS